MAYAAASCAAPVVPSQPSPPILHAIYPTPAVRSKPSINTAEIELKEVSEVDLDGDGEEEIDYDASDLEYDDDEDDEYDWSAEEDLVDEEAKFEHQMGIAQRPRAWGFKR